MDPFEIYEFLQRPPTSIPIPFILQNVLRLSSKLARHSHRDSFNIDDIRQSMVACQIPLHIVMPQTIHPNADSSSTSPPVDITDLFLRRLPKILLHKPSLHIGMMLKWSVVKGAHLHPFTGWSCMDESRLASRHEAARREAQEKILFPGSDQLVHTGFTENHQLLFNHLICSLVHTDTKVQQDAQKIFQISTALNQVLPYLTRWAGDLYSYSLKNENIEKLETWVMLCCNLCSNKSLNLIPYLMQWVPNLLNVILCNDFMDLQVMAKMTDIRLLAAKTLGELCLRDETDVFAAQCRKLLWSAVRNKDSNFGKRYVALAAIVQLGIIQGNHLVKKGASEILQLWEKECLCSEEAAAMNKNQNQNNKNILALHQKCKDLLKSLLSSID